MIIKDKGLNEEVSIMTQHLNKCKQDQDTKNLLNNYHNIEKFLTYTDKQRYFTLEDGTTTKWNSNKIPLIILLSLGPRRIEQGDDRISSVSFRKNRFYTLLKCVLFIFILNIYVSDSILSVDFTRAVSFCKQVVSSSFYPS